MGYLVPILFGEINTSLGKPKYQQIRILLDSGASSTIVNEKFVKNLRLKKSDETDWSTMAGNFRTNTKCKILFKLPELHETAKIVEDAFVTNMNSNYDMIIGRNTLSELGMVLNFKSQTIEWNDHEIPMKPTTATAETDYHVDDPECINIESQRMKNILDAKYSKTNLNEYLKEEKYDSLNNNQKEKLFKCMQKHESLFDGTLGKWTGTSYDIELKENVRPYHARPYAVPRA